MNECIGNWRDKGGAVRRQTHPILNANDKGEIVAVLAAGAVDIFALIFLFRSLARYPSFLLHMFKALCICVGYVQHINYAIFSIHFQTYYTLLSSVLSACVCVHRQTVICPAT